MAEAKKFKFDFKITGEKCMACAECFTQCKYDAVSPDPENSSYVIDQSICIRCSKCYNSCPVKGCIEKITVA